MGRKYGWPCLIVMFIVPWWSKTTTKACPSRTFSAERRYWKSEDVVRCLCASFAYFLAVSGIVMRPDYDSNCCTTIQQFRIGLVSILFSVSVSLSDFFPPKKLINKVSGNNADFFIMLKLSFHQVASVPFFKKTSSS